MAALGIGLPALFYINYVVFGGVHAVAAVCRRGGDHWRVASSWRGGCAAAAAGFGRSSPWPFRWAESGPSSRSLHHAPDQGILALLFEIFLTFAALYWFDFRRISTGVLTAILGLVAWAAVFPVGLLCDYLVPAAQIPPGLWNVPKYFVAFGMILTLLEDEFLAAGRAMEHYRLLFAAHPHPMWVQDPETLRILEVNDAAVTHYGYAREEFQSMTLGDLRPTEDVGAILKENSGTNPTKLSGPWRHRRKDGSYIQVDMASHRIDYKGRTMQFRPDTGRHRPPATA